MSSTSIKFDRVPKLKGKISATSALVLWVICSHADNETNQCWPSRERIASIANLNIRTVDKAISELAEKGYIKVTKRYNEDTKTYQSNIYTVLYEELESKPQKVTQKSGKANVGQVRLDCLSVIEQQPKKRKVYI